VPIRRLAYTSRGPQTHKDLFVLFPGRRGSYRDFERVGIVGDLRSRGSRVDIVCVDATLPYYRQRSVDQRVKADVLDAFSADEYRRTYLVGFSMGGLGALLTARRFPEDIDGVLLVSPFLGWKAILKEIGEAGGLENWQPGPHGEDDWQRMVWALLQQHSQGKGPLPPVYLAYGRQDRLHAAHRLLAPALPPERALSLPGKHHIRVFRSLLRELLLKLPDEG
jgi:pimeloyl-ACP methyl ester carboxylesterase